MRILFHLLPDRGHTTSTIPLAKALTRRGHEVVYTAVPDLQTAIESRGFRSVPIHRDIVRRGALSKLNWFGTNRQVDWDLLTTQSRVDDEYFRGSVEQIVRQIAPAVVVADTLTFSPIQFVAHRLEIPCVQLSLTLPLRFDELPPLNCALRPDTPDAVLDGARWLSSCLGRETAPLQSPMLVSTRFDRYAARFGYPSENVSFESVLCPALASPSAPEVIACASALDLKRREAHGISYVALPADLDRDEEIPSSLKSFVNPKKPLVYASLGDHGQAYPDARQFYEAVIGGLRARPDWQGVVIIDEVNARLFSELPSNAILMTGGPHLWLLRQAAAFATHAGLIEIRDAIATHVPIVAVPQRDDQLGNAVRVAHHGVGTRIPSNAITSNNFIAAVERVTSDANGCNARLRALDDACRKEESENRGVEIIERTVANRPVDSPALAIEEPAKPGSETSPRGGWLFLDPASEISKALRETKSWEDRSTGGFTICPGIGDALARAEGSMLARVEISNDCWIDGPYVVGKRLNSHWVLDFEDVLHNYAHWCAETALEPLMESSPQRVAMFKRLLTDHRELRAAGGKDKLEALADTVFGLAAPRWHDGYGAAAFAVREPIHEAARLSRFEGIMSLVRHGVAITTGSPDEANRAEQDYRKVTERFDIELDRRIADALKSGPRPRPPSS